MNHIMKINRRARGLAAFVLGATFLFNGCDPTIRTTTENGLISVATAAWGSFLTALVQVVQADLANNNANTNTNGN